MISQQATLLRTNKMGKPYVQSTDPSITNHLSPNDMWLNPSAGTMKTWNGSVWVNLQWGEDAFQDDCITNRMIANNISASKITAGTLQSQDGSFKINLETGEAELLKLVMGGQVEGNIIATSSNGLTRVRLRGREGERDVTAGIIFEQREDPNDDEGWENAGQIYFGYGNRQTYSAVQNYMIGKYDGNRPSMAYNAGSVDGLMWRALSTDWLKAGYLTYHGMRLMERADRSSPWTAVPAVCNAIGNCFDGTAIVVDGIVTVTYQLNEIARLDFQLQVTTSGSGSGDYGISRALLRTLNPDIPLITPVDGGAIQIYSALGAIATTSIGTTMKANGNLWTPAKISSGAITALSESTFTTGRIITGTCYGTYTLED